MSDNESEGQSYRIRICTVSYDEAYNVFRKELAHIRRGWPRDKYHYRFEPLSVSYANGGTHVIIIQDKEVYGKIKEELENLLQKERWQLFRMFIDRV